jgi:hypothetical protein
MESIITANIISEVLVSTAFMVLPKARHYPPTWLSTPSFNVHRYNRRSIGGNKAPPDFARIGLPFSSLARLSFFPTSS